MVFFNKGKSNQHLELLAMLQRKWLLLLPSSHVGSGREVYDPCDRAAKAAVVTSSICAVVFRMDTFQCLAFGFYAASLTAIVSTKSTLKNGLAWTNEYLYLYPMFITSAFLCGAAIQPLVTHWHEDMPQVSWFFPCLIAVHMLGPSASTLLFKLMVPYLPSQRISSTAAYVSLWMSTACIFIASIVEIVGHFEDGWAFFKGGMAADGVHNMLFGIFTVTAFALLPLSFNPTRKNIILSMLPTILMLALICGPWEWKKVKPASFTMQLITTGATAYSYQRKFDGSYWPWLFVSMATSIIRNAVRICVYENQYLHLLTGVYAFASYMFPFILTMHEATRKSPWWKVFLVWLVFTFGTDLLERYIVATFPSPHQIRKFPGVYNE